MLVCGFIAGTGRSVTVKLLNCGEVPAGVATATVRCPGVALFAMEMVTLSNEEETASIEAVTPVPENVIPVAPSKLDPLMTADTVRPCNPAFGKMPDIAGFVD